MPDVVRTQIDYYRARASEYDEWWFRQGRYDLGAAANAAWWHEVAKVESALTAADPRGEILELACGTGLWTRLLAPRATHVTALDAVAETLALNRARVGSANVDYVEADIFAWRPPQRYDFIFFGFWISHIPSDRWNAFWALLETAIAPAGKVFFVDNGPYAYGVESERSRSATDTLEERILNDGRRFTIVKNFFEPPALEAELASRGWSSVVRETETFFIYGTSQRADRGR